MAYPYINREVKCAFRWYEAARLRHRNRTLPTDPDKPSAMALPFPYATILPFQVRCAVDVTSITSWRMYDLAGAEVDNLDTHIGELVVAQYANPDRAIVCLQERLVILDLPTGVYEMQLVTNTGSILYSETFEILCGKDAYSLANSELTSGTTNWGYGDWNGRLGEVMTTTGEPPREGYLTEQVANLFDNVLLTWNGSSWVTSTPANNSYWTIGVGQTWYIFSGGAWSEAGAPPILPNPDAGGGFTCWAGLYRVPWIYTPLTSELPGFVRLNFCIFKGGGGFVGDINVFAGDTFIGNYTTNECVEVVVYLEPGDTIDFLPSADFDGCVTTSNFQAIADGTECMTKLQWNNCGDLGSTAYTIGEGLFTNILYLREGTGPISGAVWEPTPLITVSPETNQRGDSIQTRVRKDTNWSLQMGNMPWHVLDAISELPTVDTAVIKVPWGRGDDTMISPRIDVTWSAMMLQGDGTLVFQVDDATVNSGCCEMFDRPCPESCGTADGIFGVDELVIGQTYLYNGGVIATYCSLDCEEPVDAEGFNNIVECPYGIAQTTSPDRPWMRWNGTLWVPLVEITSAEGVDLDCETIMVIASMPSGYMGQLQSTIDGETWTDLGVASSAAQWAVGVEVTPVVNTMYLRLRVYGFDECVLGTSLVVPAPCACPFWVFSTNLAANCDDLPQTISALFQPYSYNGSSILHMVDIGESVTMEYRINAGPWTAIENPGTTSDFYTGEMTFDTGDVLELRVLPTERPWCTYSVSQEFECP